MLTCRTSCPGCAYFNLLTRLRTFSVRFHSFLSPRPGKGFGIPATHFRVPASSPGSPPNKQRFSNRWTWHLFRVQLRQPLFRRLLYKEE
ncbi:hypothetical protein ILYODFUR_016767 [Ilyodon furcidens]|uniref:Uncharacterized protein n=1 Tax=Ilyodon furcidens TaxID=33524 RepID=A0ABV0VG53_9TELE